jgi:hypothetical protein
MQESHLLSIAIIITVDHAANDRLNSRNSAALLGTTEPHLDVEVLTLSGFSLLLLNIPLYCLLIL